MGLTKTGGMIAAVLAIAALSARADSIELLAGCRIEQQTDAGSESIDLFSLPTQTSSLVSGESGYGAGTYDLLAAVFDFGLQHAGVSEGFFGRSIGEIYFYVPEELEYRLSAEFSSEGSSSWTTFLDLANLTTGQTMYANVQFNGSDPLPDVIPGDALGQNEGDAQGMLPGGHKFRLRYVLHSILTEGQSAGPTEPGMFTGDLSSTFGPESVVVPLPPAAWTGISLLGSMVAFRLYRHGRRRFGPTL